MSSPLETAPPPALFDVYIVGSQGLDAPGRQKLAALLATRYASLGATALSIAEGLAGGRCTIGKRLEQAAADRLVEELGDLGAETHLQPAGTPLRITTGRTGGRPDIVRCPAHGLSYDRSRSSGCLRCLQPARAAARSIERQLYASRLRELLENPVKRAFTGLALALLLGLVPAAYYARGVCGGEVRAIRARQAALVERSGGEELDRELARLDQAVDGVRRRGMRNTALLWLLVSGIAGAGWQRLSPRTSREY
jgi:hypothetical protein